MKGRGESEIKSPISFSGWLIADRKLLVEKKPTQCITCTLITLKGVLTCLGAYGVLDIMCTLMINLTTVVNKHNWDQTHFPVEAL